MSEIKYYNKIELPDGPFGFSHVHESQIINILVKFDTNKAAGIDGLSGTFLKDGAKILSKPITDLINLSILLSPFPESYKAEAAVQERVQIGTKKLQTYFPPSPDFKGS